MNNSTLDILDNEELLSLIRWQIDREQFGDALISTKHALLRDNKSPENYKLAAKIYAQLGLFEHAKKAFEDFLILEPESLIEKFQYGMVHYDSGDSDKAADIWNELLEKDSTFPPALFYSALASANTDQPERAIKHLDTLIKSAPSDNLYFERGRELLRSIEENQSGSDNKDNQNSLNKYTNDDERTIN